MGYNNIQHGLQNSAIYSNSGAARIIFAAFEDVRGYSVVSGDTVDSIILDSGRQYHLFNDLDDISYLLTTTATKSGKLYQLDVSFTVPNETGQKNTLFDQMLDTNLVAVVQDNNFNWWLLGHEQPLRVVSNEGKIDNDNNGYTVKLSTKQRELPYHMSSTWIENINSLPFSTSLDTTDGILIPITIQVGMPTDNGSLPTSNTNAANIKIAPASGYVIEANIDYVFALGGTTIKLPINPKDGQSHTIKDYQGIAHLSPITVDGNGRVIDKDSTFTLNTEEGAISVIYAGAKWHTYTFIN